MYKTVLQQRDAASLKDLGQKNFPQTLVAFYRLVLGDYDFDGSFAGTFTGEVLFLGVTFLFIVVFLNLLIALMTDGYQRIMDESLSAFYSERCSILLELVSLPGAKHRLMANESGRDKYLYRIVPTRWGSDADITGNAWGGSVHLIYVKNKMLQSAIWNRFRNELKFWWAVFDDDFDFWFNRFWWTNVKFNLRTILRMNILSNELYNANRNLNGFVGRNSTKQQTKTMKHRHKRWRISLMAWPRLMQARCPIYAIRLLSWKRCCTRMLIWRNGNYFFRFEQNLII